MKTYNTPCNLDANIEEKDIKKAGGNSMASRQNGKNRSFANFLEMCTTEHKVQFLNEQLDENDLQRKCTNRWKNMTKKEKAYFEQLTKRKKL